MPNLFVTATTRYDPKGLNKAKKHISNFEKSVKAMGKTFAGVFAAQKLLQFGKASVKAFVADDKAVRMLGNSLKNIGASYAATGVEDFIAKLQKTTGVLDDALRPALQTLLTATGDVTKSQNALALALDVSQATGKDLSAVSVALAKGFQGNTTALAKMGGAVSKAALATGDMNKITAELTAKYKGSALIAAAGYSGQMDKLAVASANAKEIIGKGLLNSISLLSGQNGVSDTADSMERLATNTADVIKGIAVLAAKLKGFKLFDAITSTLSDVVTAGPLGGLARLGQSKVKTGYGQQSPGDRNMAVSTNKKLQLQKTQELAALLAKNKATKEEAQMKKDQAALDALKAKFDLERIGLNAALLNATDEETKARIKAQIAILDETGKTAQAANDALVKAQADKVTAELKAADAVGKLADAANKASIYLTTLQAAQQTLTSIAAAVSGSSTPTGLAKGGALVGDFVAPVSTQTAMGASIDSILEYADAATARANAIADILETQNRIDAINFNNSDLVNYGGAMAMPSGPVVTINAGVIAYPDELASLIRKEIQSQNRQGNSLTYAGAL